MIPDFQSNGMLPSGDHEVTFEELRTSSLVEGPPNRSATWDSAWRGLLVDNLEVLCKQLWRAGISEIFVDGSFAEDKDHPNDIDGYFVCDLRDLASGNLAARLNRLDPYKIWTWDPASRQPYRGYPKFQLPMWHLNRVELYPHTPGLSSGLRDRHGHDMGVPVCFSSISPQRRTAGHHQIAF